jgi:pimeloyl-ACP methyl ester carboxylesterase
MPLLAGILAGLLLLAGCVIAPAPGKRIEEASYLSIGGIQQWVTIRGDDNRKPVLFLLHGGPGDVQSPFVATYAPYEHDFVLVQWDQRGGGRTFLKNGGKITGLSLDQQVADGINLALQLRARFPKQKLILLGHSWGSIVATTMVQKRPDLFSAYVGTGQATSWPAIVNAQFDYLKETARAKNNAALLAQLDAIGRPDPKNTGQYFGTIARALRANSGPADTAWLAGIPDLLKASPGLTDAEIKAGNAGMSASALALLATLMASDLPLTAPSLPIPYCIIQGRDDLNAPTVTVVPYFSEMSAPAKKLTILGGAGHFALATNAPEFAAAIKRCPGVG